ncbi:MAG: DMT family transporter [Sulfurospirillaceae bacterium]|nr:DMT family transporter [Sulfurospirillaceae bacterium]
MHYEKKSVALGMLGILAFSLTLPMTHIALYELSPVFISFGRAIIAAILASFALLVTKAKIPTINQFKMLATAALGVVVGFPFFSAVALMSVPVSHGGVVAGILPLCTAFFGVILAHEKLKMRFWISSLVGSAAILWLTMSDKSLVLGDTFLLAAVISAGYGYAQGAIVSKELGSWQSISWMLVISAPVLIFPTIYTMPSDISELHFATIGSFLYLGSISMYLGFFFWYKALSIGGIARIGQFQLLQPFMTLFFAWILLKESVQVNEIFTAIVVVISVFFGRKNKKEIL